MHKKIVVTIKEKGEDNNYVTAYIILVKLM